MVKTTQRSTREVFEPRQVRVLPDEQLVAGVLGLAAIFIVGLLFTGSATTTTTSGHTVSPRCRSVSTPLAGRSGRPDRELGERVPPMAARRPDRVPDPEGLVGVQRIPPRSQDFDRDLRDADKRRDLPCPSAAAAFGGALRELAVPRLLVPIPGLARAARRLRLARLQLQARGARRRVRVAVEYVRSSRFWFESFQNWR